MSCGHVHLPNTHTCGYASAEEATCECKRQPEAIHKWQRCDQCRHPEHPSACSVCRCLSLTSAAEIAERCRGAGGCPKHPRPKPEPILSDRCKCSHIRFRHNYDTEDGPCSKPDCDCEAYAPVVIEDVELPEAQCTAACSEGHTYSGSCMLRAHGPRPGPCQCGCAAEAHMGRPTGCRAHGLHEFEPEPEQHECTTDVRYFCPVADATESACHGGFDTCCSDPARHVIIGPCQHGEELVAECSCTPLCGCCPSLPAPPPPQPERRPPYAIAYSVEGHLYEAWLPGDATVAAVDGVLVIQHNGRTVNGITQVLPVRQEK